MNYLFLSFFISSQLFSCFKEQVKGQLGKFVNKELVQIKVVDGLAMV